MGRRFKADPKWISVRYSARCAEPNCQTEIQRWRASLLLPHCGAADFDRRPTRLYIKPLATADYAGTWS